ncbi:class I SAM-dependent methyltransferase [Empedobacter brevis]|uniref:Class I SAM-dependent methyltransferase n=1 Tax=Empedobacter brevis TaxID=247 RepID=A0AAJ1VA41_9FLAO|nr:class I SAM-dependent methyltransferase [Empedobacter brevis]MDM1073385.1 class I SAM-dependent methyltransferase [Empedobacter brevis]QES92025.1 class I SAM-dependent methyltransferase [Empedobacter brevis]QHC83796.1 methyltransferase [Empedobacter brevis]
MENVPRETSQENPSKEGFSGIKKLDLNDYFLTGEKFELFEDLKTEVLYTLPQPIENLGKYYESKNYISHTDGKKSIFERFYQMAKQINLNNKLELIDQIAKGKKVLDYGCGVGDFLEHLQKNGYDVLGMEPNDSAKKIAQSKIGTEKVTSTELEQNDQKFDIITLWHVLEHIPNLNEIIIQLKNHLTEDGRLIIAVPNHKSYDAAYYGKYWAAYDVPRHLWHFSATSMNKLFNNFGMKIESTHPMKLDSFYVSLLSEKYKGNKLGFINALRVGLKSNSKAKKTGEYSSLIYIIKAEN